MKLFNCTARIGMHVGCDDAGPFAMDAERQGAFSGDRVGPLWIAIRVCPTFFLGTVFKRISLDFRPVMATIVQTIGWFSSGKSLRGRSGAFSSLVIICQLMTHWSELLPVSNSGSCNEAVSPSPRKPRSGLYQPLPGVSGWKQISISNIFPSVLNAAET